MQSLEEQQDPSFASVTEPDQLQRLHCDQCHVAIADYECERCVQRFCRQCELVIHHRLAELAVKREESKSDGRPHQEFLKWISACQECGQNTQEFFCIHCNAYQCDSCCANKHRQLEHFFFCVEGSSPKMLPYATWNIMFVEMVKMSKGDLQDRAAALEAAMRLANERAAEIPDAKLSATAAGQIKLEQAASTNATTTALGNLSIQGQDALPQTAAKSQAKHSSRVNSTSIVDLTLDDESDASTSSQPSRPPPALPHIKEEFRVKTESAWRDSFIAAQETPVLDVDQQMEKILGDDEDTILRSMISEYNQLSAKIFDIDQETNSVTKKTKELSSAKPINMQEMIKARNLTKKLRSDKAEAEKSREAVVGNIVVYIKSDPEEMNAFLETCVADVPPALTAIHRKCATLEASIHSNLENLQKIQRNMEELMSIEKDAFAEVTRLGAEIAEGEEEVRRLDKERQEEFLRLCQFSKSIQTTVREIAVAI
ncbi:hypothetical protein PHMEG_00011058 [Phytophthora megakarya]|uniref:B box-type domain-containing protein n=1 Tax=Phytophthora megakarya TaxID=4795 RepID=A0A225WC59_9STRA|nr:hypothetical protein PHMEG_00011058 [Phytophthora megakarya]